MYALPKKTTYYRSRRYCERCLPVHKTMEEAFRSMPWTEAVTVTAIRTLTNWTIRYFDHVNVDCIFVCCYTPVEELLKHNAYRVFVYAGIEDFCICESCFNNGRILDYHDTFESIQEEIEIYYHRLQQ